jgi:hypothetical protein
LIYESHFLREGVTGMEAYKNKATEINFIYLETVTVIKETKVNGSSALVMMTCFKETRLILIFFG